MVKIILFLLMQVLNSNTAMADASVVTDSAKQCVLSDKEKQDVKNCAEIYKQKECASLKEDPTFGPYLFTCDPREIRADASLVLTQAKDSCIAGLKSALEEFQNILSNLGSGIEGMVEEEKVAQALCMTELGYNRNPIELDREMALRPVQGESKQAFQAASNERQLWRRNPNYKRFRDCVDAKKKTDLPTLEELYEFIRYYARVAQCTRYETHTQFVCPALAPAGILAFSGLGVKALRPILSLRALNSPLGKLFRELEEYAQGKPALVRSLQHGRELISMSDHPPFSILIDLFGIDRNVFRMALVESDIGKIPKVWDKFLLSNTEDARKNIMALQGKGGSKAGDEFKKILSAEQGSNKGPEQGSKRGTEKGSNKGALLNPSLRPEEVVYLFNQGSPLKDYLHQLPGLARVFDDFNYNRITPQEFKTRVETILYHDGPYAGFQKFYSEVIFPTIPEEKLGLDLIKDTVFEGKGQAVVDLPDPVSPSGFIHQLMDRHSLASGIGPKKVFYELMSKGETGKLRHLKESLIEVPTRALEQIEAMEKSLLSDTQAFQITYPQKQALLSAVRAVKDRTKREIAYLKDRIEVVEGDGKIEQIKLKINGREIEVNNSTTGDEMARHIDDLLKEERQRNGDPVTELIRTPSKKKVLALPAFAMLCPGLFGPQDATSAGKDSSALGAN